MILLRINNEGIEFEHRGAIFRMREEDGGCALFLQQEERWLFIQAWPSRTGDSRAIRRKLRTVTEMDAVILGARL